MKPNTIYTGTYGTDLTFEIQGDVQVGDTLKLKIRNPNKVRNEISLGSATQENVDNKTVTYNIQKYTFSAQGTYKIQVFRENDTIREAVTPIENLKVNASLDFVER
jgi:hypothetical protein